METDSKFYKKREISEKRNETRNLDLVDDRRRFRNARRLRFSAFGRIDFESRRKRSRNASRFAKLRCNSFALNNSASDIRQLLSEQSGRPIRAEAKNRIAQKNNEIIYSHFYIFYFYFSGVCRKRAADGF